MIWDFFEVSVWQLLVLLLHVWNYVSSTANVKASAGPEPGWGTGELVTQKEIRCASTDCDITRRSVTSDILQPCRGWWSPMTTMVHIYIYIHIYIYFFIIYILRCPTTNQMLSWYFLLILRFCEILWVFESKRETWSFSQMAPRATRMMDMPKACEGRTAHGEIMAEKA